MKPLTLPRIFKWLIIIGLTFYFFLATADAQKKDSLKLYRNSSSLGMALSDEMGNYYYEAHDSSGIILWWKYKSDTLEIGYPQIKVLRIGKHFYKVDSNRVIHLN